MKQVPFSVPTASWAHLSCCPHCSVCWALLHVFLPIRPRVFWGARTMVLLSHILEHNRYLINICWIHLKKLRTRLNALWRRLLPGILKNKIYIWNRSLKRVSGKPEQAKINSRMKGRNKTNRQQTAGTVWYKRQDEKVYYLLVLCLAPKLRSSWLPEFVELKFIIYIFLF